MIVALTGASGFIGTRLIAHLTREGHTVRALGRSAPRVSPVQFFRWDAMHQLAPAEALDGADAVIHLAGEPVGQRWNEEVKRRIRDSRIAGTRNLVEGIRGLARPPAVLVSSSAVGYYGDRGDEVLRETSAPATDFLARVCIEWEREASRATEAGVRVCALRTGIVLGKEGGALHQMLPPFRAGVGGPLASGKQWVSWIHVEDMVELILSAAGGTFDGPVNATAPNPVRNEQFAHALGAAIRRPARIHTPAFAIKLMFGEMAKVMLASQRVIPEAASRAGFSFRYPEIEGALRQLLTS